MQLTFGWEKLLVGKELWEIQRTKLSPGIYFGLNEDAYHKDGALNASGLKLLHMYPGGREFYISWHPFLS